MNIIIPICVSFVTLGILFLIYYIITVLIELRNTLVNVTRATTLLTKEIERVDVIISNIFIVVEKVKNVFSGSSVIIKGLSIIGSIVSFFKRKKKGGVQNVGKK